MDGGSSLELASAATRTLWKSIGEEVMRRWLFVLPLLVAPQALAQQAVPTINFESVPNPLKLPTNMYFGEVSGVAVNSKGHVFALSRGRSEEHTSELQSQ